MRISYREDEDYPNAAELFLANVERSLKGKKGQAALQKVEAALLAMPQKRLITDVLETAEGEVCALGALAKHMQVAIPEPTVPDYNEWEENESYEDLIKFAVEQLGIPRLVAFRVIEVNDNTQYRFLGGRDRHYYTPEERYEKVLAWVRKRLNVPA